MPEFPDSKSYIDIWSGTCVDYKESSALSSQNAETIGQDGLPVPHKHGEPFKYDPKFKGPVDIMPFRRTTDVIFCFVFWVFIFGMIIVMSVGFIRGDPNLIIYPRDSYEHACGAGVFEDRPYLFFFDPIATKNGYPTQQVCVSKCPSKTFSPLVTNQTSDKKDLICQHYVHLTIDMTVEDLHSKIRQGLCAAYYLDSKLLYNRCVPKNVSKLFENVLKDDVQLKRIKNRQVVPVEAAELVRGLDKISEMQEPSDWGKKAFQSIYQSLDTIVICVAITLAVSMMWVLLLRYMTLSTIWITVFLFIFLMVMLIYISFQKLFNITLEDFIGYQKEDQSQLIDEEQYVRYISNLEFDRRSATLVIWIIILSITLVVMILFITISCCIHKKVNLSVRLMQESSLAISRMWTVLVWPMVPFLLQVSWIAFWLFSMMYIVTIAKPEFSRPVNSGKNSELELPKELIPCDTRSSTEEVCRSVKYKGFDYTTVMVLYMVFMYFWVMNFISGLSQMTMAGAIASYYWALDKEKDVPEWPVMASLSRCMRYHTGSLAFGSLLVSQVKLITLAIDHLHFYLQNSKNNCARCLSKCLKCLFWSVDKYLLYTNKVAYFLIAVHSMSFCTASKQAYNLVLRNCPKVSNLNSICNVLVLVCNLVMSVSVGIVSYILIEMEVFDVLVPTPYEDDYLWPVLVAALAAYMVAGTFMDVYDTGVQAIFFCFLEDHERNDGSSGKPYHMENSTNMYSLLHEQIELVPVSKDYTTTDTQVKEEVGSSAEVVEQTSSGTGRHGQYQKVQNNRNMSMNLSLADCLIPSETKCIF